jgi:hypothetical protein
MKAKLLLSLILTFAVSTVAQDSPQNAKPKPAPAKQDQPASTPVPQPGDPFLHGGPSTKPNQPSGPPINVYGLLEYIEVPRDAWLAYSAAKPSGSDATALRAEVQSWIKAGKAKSIELTCVPTKSGQRMVIESLIERLYPAKYLQVAPSPVPSAFEKRNTGLTLEWEPLADPARPTVDSQLAVTIVRLVGNASNTLTEKKITQPGDAGRPQVLTHKATVSISSQSSQPVLVDVITPIDAAGNPRDEVRWLLFFRGAAMPPAKPEKDTSQPANQRLEKSDAQLMLELERLEVSLADLNAWFAAKDLEAGTNGLKAAALDWIRAGRGREFDRRCVPAKSGLRQLWESNSEINYATSYKNDPVVAPAAFETRVAGYTVEIEPVLGPDGETVDLSLVPQEVRYRNATIFPQTELNGRSVPAIEQPIFSTMKISTTLFTNLGQPSLLAIGTPANETGEPDPQWRVLTFVTFRK